MTRLDRSWIRLGIPTIVLLAAAVLLPASALAQPPANFAVEDVITGLNQPMAIRFLPDGRMLLIQKQGPVRIVDVLSNPVQSAEYMNLTLAANGLNFGNERGVLDIAVDPNFPAQPYVYVFYTPATGASGARARISRFTHQENGGGVASRGNLSSEVVLWQDSDGYDSCCHYGGGLDFGPDGHLWLSTGDHFQGSYAASLQHAGGKVHRITKSGSIPSGNPYVDGAGPNIDSIFAYGLRNPFRSRWDLVTRRFYIAEVGGNTHSIAWEDLHVIRQDPASGRFQDNDFGTPSDNLVYNGINFGWPTVEGLPPHTDFPGATIDSIAGEPVFAYKHNGNGSSITGGIIYRGNQFPGEYVDAYFYSDSTRNFIRYVKFNSNGTVAPNPDPDPISLLNPDSMSYSFDLTPVGRIVALDVGPDGALYYVSLADPDSGLGAVRRYVYDGGNNRPAITHFTATPSTGTSPLSVNFSFSATDLESDPMTYVLRFGDGTSTPVTNLVDGTTVNLQHTYLVDGLFEARLEVADATHNSIARTAIQVGTPPVVTSLTSFNPRRGSSNTMFRFGDTLTISGTATDAEDGALSAAAFSWSIVFVRPENTHPVVGPVGGISSIDFPIPAQGQGFSGSVFYRITLTVTDSSGLSSSGYIDVFPEKSDIQFQTVPAGIVVQVDGNTAQPTPFVLDTLINYDHTITVPSVVCISGVEYTFASWSNGPTTPQQVYNVPATDSSLTATYVSGGGCSGPQPQGLVLHLRSDAGLVLSGGNVLQWDDQASGGNHLVAVGVPTYLGNAVNGRPAVHFDGIDDALARTAFTGLPAGSGERSVFMVVRYNVATTTAGWAGFTYGTAANNAAFGLSLTPAGVLGVQGWGSGNDYVSNPATNGVGQWLIHSAVVGGGTLTQYRDGTAIGSAVHTYNTGTSGIRLGEELNGKKNLDMDVAEILVYNRALNSAELQQVADYFHARYGLGSPSGNTIPAVTITAPADGASVSTATLPLTLTGTATDTEDGDIGNALTWSSSLDGPLGTGKSIAVSLSVGTHVITASVTDSGSLQGSDTVTVTVFSPGALVTTGLVLRLESDQVLLASGTTVARWPDLSGNGNDLIAAGGPQLTSASTPSGQPGIALDGSDDRLERLHATHPLTNLPTGSADRTVFLVTRYNDPNATVAGWVGFAYGTAASNGAFGLSLTPTGLLGVQGWGSSNDFVSSPPTNGVGAWLIQAATVSSNVVSQYRDNVAIGSKSQTYNTGTTAIRLGEELNGNKNLNMDVAAVLVYNRALSAAERDAVYGYLANKFLTASGNTAPTVEITTPVDGAAFELGTAIGFMGTASDTQDGDLSAQLAWTSSRDGNLGTGASIVATLSVGTHVITARVTDSGLLTGSDTISITVTDTGGGPPPGITLSVTGYKVKGLQKADLVWSGATSDQVDVYRNDVKMTTDNDGLFTDDINAKGGGSYSYKVCEAGTTTCSNVVTITF